jgi:beta-lactamase class A
MRRIILLFLIPVCVNAQPAHSLAALKQQIEDTLSMVKGNFAVAFIDLRTGAQVLINEHKVFHAASTMKTPVMMEVFRQAADKKISLHDSLTITNEFSSIVDSTPFSLDSTDDSETELYRHIGQRTTIDSLLKAMITKSSNLATNLLIAKVGASSVTAFVRKLGAGQLTVMRGVEDQKAFDHGLNNVVTAWDLMLLFEQLARMQVVNRKASEAMINILLGQEFNDIIPAMLPAGIKVAHKTGFITGLHHDSGIVFLPHHRKYVLVLLSDSLPVEDPAIHAMARVSRMIYDYETSAAKR